VIRSDLRPYLGRVVTVTIDRPLGSRHPRHPDLCYPINYGHIAGTSAGDGEPIDAYVLGIDEPLSEIEATVIALVLRENDVEDKLVVAPAGLRFSPAEIRAMVDFQEHYFLSQIVVITDPIKSNDTSLCRSSAP
jgi:inorganic pyrophosphatase